MTVGKERLAVLLHGERIAILERLPHGGSALTFEDSYLQSVPRPTLGQWFIDQDLTRTLRHPGLPPFFQNLLPEGWMRAAIARHLGADADDFALLRQVGLDLAGAVSVEETNDTVPPRRRGETSFSERGVEPVRSESIRFSLAGTQPKLSVARGERITVHSEGRGGSWILKLPTADFPGLPELEHAVMSWARASRLTVPDTDTVDTTIIDGLPEELRARVEQSGSKAYLCARYDRSSDGAIHQEDFAQMRNVPAVPPEAKYDRSHGYVELVRDLDTVAPDDTNAFLARLVFDVVAGNGDSHLKNWSLIYPDRINAQLSPSYDLVSTVAYRWMPAELALPLEGEKRMKAVTRSTFRALAKKLARDPDAVEELAHRTAASIRKAFAEQSGEWGLWPEHRERIEEHLGQVKLGL